MNKHPLISSLILFLNKIRVSSFILLKSRSDFTHLCTVYICMYDALSSHILYLTLLRSKSKLHNYINGCLGYFLSFFFFLSIFIAQYFRLKKVFVERFLLNTFTVVHERMLYVVALVQFIFSNFKKEHRSRILNYCVQNNRVAFSHCFTLYIMYMHTTQKFNLLQLKNKTIFLRL